MLFADLVETSRRVTATSRRLSKIELLSQFLLRLPPEEAEAAVAFLSGIIRQGRIGAGYSLIRSLTAGSARQASLSIADIDQAFTEFQQIRGTGSAKRKQDLLQSVFER